MVVDGQATPVRRFVPDGNVSLFQEVHPSTVLRIGPRPEAGIAEQVVVDGQEIPPPEYTPLSARSLHVAPESVVAAMISVSVPGGT